MQITYLSKDLRMRRQYSMATKLPAIMASACLLFGFLSWAAIVSQTSTLAQQAVEDKSTATLNQLAELVRAPLFSNDTVGLQFALRKATMDQSIFSASLYDVEDNLIAQSTQAKELSTSLTQFRQDITLEDTQAGTLLISVISQPIYEKYSNIFLIWAFIWLLFSIGCTYACYQFAEQLARRLRALTNRLPGSSDPMIDEILELETRIQPLLTTSGQFSKDTENGYYCSLVTATIKNRQSLNDHLNHENLELLFENIDHCIDRTLELYGAKRIEGSKSRVFFYIRSTECSKQHLLVCLMAVYSLQKLLDRLSVKLGIDLEINWTVCSDNLSPLPVLRYHEKMSELKHRSKSISERIDKGVIALYVSEYDIEQLATIARFNPFEENCYIFHGFPEQRQVLLEKQILHLASVCL
jgi:uncharacterized membrane protein affecting hemolysin expression